MKDSKLFRVGKNDVTKTRPGMAAKYSFKMAASEVASFETNFFRIADTLESETSVSRKAKTLSFSFKPKCKANYSQHSSKKRPSRCIDI